MFILGFLKQYSNHFADAEKLIYYCETLLQAIWRYCFRNGDGQHKPSLYHSVRVCAILYHAGTHWELTRTKPLQPGVGYGTPRRSDCVHVNPRLGNEMRWIQARIDVHTAAAAGGDISHPWLQRLGARQFPMRANMLRNNTNMYRIVQNGDGQHKPSLYHSVRVCAIS